MVEWFKAAVLKTASNRVTAMCGLESHHFLNYQQQSIMTGRFRAINKISKHKMSLLWDRAFAVLTKECAVVNAINKGFSEESKQVVTKRFDYLESLISTGHLEKMPRKMKKAFIRELSARYNLCLIILQHWDEFKEIKA